MKGEAEKKSSTSRDAVKENQSQVESSASSTTAAQNNAPPARQPFTQLSQLESDMALARALQEQERAYMLLRTGGYNGNNVGDEDSDDEDDEDNQVPTVEAIDGSQYDNDEEFARALQEAEYRETTARMMALAGIQDLDEDDGGSEAGEDDDEDEQDVEGDNDNEDEEEDEDADVDEDDGGEDDEEDYEDEDSQEMWQDVDPDNMSYEELIALGEVVGTESRGLASSVIDELPISSYKRDESESTSSDCEQCVICRHDYEEEEKLLTLPCKHKYHSDCIRQWLQINKVCPVCSAGVDDS